jgi:kinesin family protein 3/17
MFYRDLLNKDQTKKYELRENMDVGVYVKDLSSFVCKSVKEIEQVMCVGNQNRKIGYVCGITAGTPLISGTVYYS